MSKKVFGHAESISSFPLLPKLCNEPPGVGEVEISF